MGKRCGRQTSEGASYSSPTSTSVSGQPLAIFVTRLNTVALSPADGSVRFRFPFGARGPTVNAATPLVFDQRLFVSAAYGVGARLVRVQSQEAEMLWNKQDVMSSQYTTCVFHQNHLYGTHGREDYQNGELRCVDTTDGNVRWTVSGTGVAHLILVRERLLILNSAGTLTLAEASA